MFNNQVWHRGGPNRSERVRYMTQVSYARRIIGHRYFPFMNYQMPEHCYRGANPRKKRLLTGLRPTGRFHLGNYVGTFEKDLELQNSGEYECFFLIADYHTLTTGYETA